MKLLILSNNLNRAGYRQRIAVYLDILKENAIQCKVAQLPSNYLLRWKLFKRAEDFDAVLLHKKGLNPLDAFFLKRYSKKIIYHFDDAIMYSPKDPESHSSPHFRSFRRSVKLADTVIAASSYLAKHALKFNPNVIVLSTGIKISDYQFDCPHENDDKIRLVWIGSRSTLSYIEQLKPVLEEIGSRFDNVILRIIGDDFFGLQNMKVEKRVWKKETRGIDLAECDIGLAPLPDNRFTQGKCSFKVLEYSAAGLPVVASPIGTNSLHVCENMTGFLAQNPQEWINKISSLIEDEKLRREMGDAGRVHVQQFDRNVIGEQLCGLIVKSISDVAKKPELIEILPKTAVGQHTPKVSICISTYNRKDYLKETIDSILAQTYKDYEIVIVDDGSTDGTKEFVKSLNCPIKYFWQRNAGDSVAKNKLIELANGKYITFIDSDDLLLPDSIENLVKIIESEEETIIAYGPYYRIDENSKIYGRCKRKLYNGKITKYLFQTILVHNCGTMYPSNILKEYKGYDCTLPACYDYDLNLRISLNYKFRTTAKPVFKRRRHLNNLSYPSFENCLTEFKVLKDFYYNKGGKDVIPEKIAMKVFSKEARRAGRCAIKEGLHDQACQFLRQSFRQHPNLKSLISWIRAMIVKRLAL